MKQYIKQFIFLAAFTLIFAVGCDDRGTNSLDQAELQEGGIDPRKHTFATELGLQINNKDMNMLMSIYIPKVAIPSIADPSAVEPIPLLILLAPQDGGQYYYFNHGLKEVADRLISDGVIEPMAIACIPNDDYLGGFFYAGNYPAGGRYDDLIGGSLIDHLEYSWPWIISSPDKRGIGGIGQGAYGAFRAAIKHPGVFTSLSAIDGPLDFDGPDGKGGFYQLFDDALREQPSSLTDIKDFRIEGEMHLSRMMAGAAYAFSPHDTLIDWEIDEFNRIKINARYSLTDNTTLVNSNPNDLNLFFHLPFDINGIRYLPIWQDMWLPNNLENMLTPGIFDGLNIWVATSSQNNYGRFHEQTASFISTLQAEGYPVTTKTYTGYSGSPAEKDQYLYDLLEDILIFHNENFKD